MANETAERHLPLKADVLEIMLAIAEEPMHGYAILSHVRERTQGRVALETGPLYRRLRRLLDDGLVQEVEVPDDTGGGDDRRRYYAPSELGRRVLALEAERLETVVRRQRALGLLGG